MKYFLAKSIVAISTLALMSCNKPDEKNENSAELAKTTLLPSAKVASIEPYEIRYGDPTNKENLDDFNPVYDVIAYFSIDNNILYSSVQYFKRTGNDFPSIKLNVERCLAILDAAPINALPACPDSLKVTDFSDFTVKGASNFVFATKTQSMRFVDSESLVFGKKLLNEHAGYNDGPSDPIADRKKAKPNKSFYNADLYDAAGRRVLYVQNYYTRKSEGNENDQGNGDVAVGRKPHWYSMKIFVWMDQGHGQPSKHIIDPDGGNMGGGNP